MASCSEAYNRKQKLQMPKPVGLNASKNSGSSKCQAFCSPWEFKPEANCFKWWDADSPSPIVEDNLDHFGAKNAREREKELGSTVC